MIKKNTAAGPHSHHTGVLSCIVNGLPTPVFHDFVEYMWVQGGGMGSVTIVEVGEKDHLYSLRAIGSVQEYCVDSVAGQHFVYTVYQGLPLVSTYRGSIVFESAGEGRVKISWQSHFTPVYPGATLGGIDIGTFLTEQALGPSLKSYEISRMEKRIF